MSSTLKPAATIGEHIDGTDFADVVSLYEADRKLRTLIHDGMERIEVAMRTKIIELLCARHPGDPTFYLKSDDFRPNFDHVSWLSTAYGRLARAKKSDAVKHYIDEYGGQYPMWVVAEVLDFSDISKLYAGLGSNDQRSISEALDIKINFSSLNRNQKQRLTKKHPLASWLEQLTVIRNTCAHHGRLWNRSCVHGANHYAEEGEEVPDDYPSDYGPNALMIPATSPARRIWAITNVRISPHGPQQRHRFRRTKRQIETRTPLSPRAFPSRSPLGATALLNQSSTAFTDAIAPLLVLKNAETTDSFSP